MPTLTWNELKDGAAAIFSVWVGQPELRFAKEAWRHLARAGLADYKTELEKTEVKIRVLALGCVYLDFCALAWDESRPPDFSEWAYN